MCKQSIEREQGILQLDRGTIGPLVRVLQVDNVKLGSEVGAGFQGTRALGGGALCIEGQPHTIREVAAS